MNGRVIISLLVATGAAAGAPIEETFYQILGPDQITVLCDSRTPGSCDPFVAEIDFLNVSAGSVFTLSPTRLIAGTNFTFRSEDMESENYVRARYFFEDEIDLGWYKFEDTLGQTGDFFARYSPFFDRYSDSGGAIGALSIDPGPFPLGSNTPQTVFATLGQPFQVKGRYSFSVDIMFPARGGGPGSGYVAADSYFMHGVPLDIGGFLDVQVVPVPEPGGLSLFALCALAIKISAGSARRPRRGSAR